MTVELRPADGGPGRSDLSDVVLLLGAGASVDAGIPDMTGMYDLFVDSLDVDDRGFVEAVAADLSAWGRGLNRKPKDVEVLLAGLTRYAALEQDLTLALLHQSPPDNTAEAVRLATRLRRHIRRMCLGMDHRIDHAYLIALVRLAYRYGALDVFSLNYDMCIERASRDASIRCETGFTLEWTPSRFQDIGSPESPILRLHKLHGSVSWYQTDDYQYRHIPIRSDEPLEDIDGRRLTEMIVYPELEKEPDLSPYPFLLGRFRDAVMSTRVLAVIGYSFGDRSLRETITEALNRNGQLQVVIVDPADEPRIPAGWSSARFVHIKEKLKPLLQSDRLGRAVSGIVEAGQAFTRAQQANPLAAGQARIDFTTAVSNYLEIGHREAAYVVVRAAAAANVGEGTQARDMIVPTARDWLDAFPAPNSEAASSWWRVGANHARAIEFHVLTRVSNLLGGGIAGQRIQEMLSRFGSASVPYPVPDENVLRSFQAVARLHRGAISGESLRARALDRLLVHLAMLERIDRLWADRPEDWAEAVLPVLGEYGQEYAGLAQDCSTVADAPV